MIRKEMYFFSMTEMIKPRSIMAAVITAVILKVAEIVILPYCRNLSGAVT